MLYLFYAGMAADRETEQIGLAQSDDGLAFRRWNGDGLIVPRDARVAWKSLRTCNPAVLHHRGQWVMYYQGVGPTPAGRVTHVIARAVSADGLHWQCDAEPALRFDDVRAASAEFAAAPDGGVIEPALLSDGESLTMFFVAYQDTYRRGTWLMTARSRSGERWTVDATPIVGASAFPGCRIHYPQAISAGEIWASVISVHSPAAAIVRLDRGASERWSATQVLPASRTGALHVGPAEMFPIRIAGSTPKGLWRLNQAANRWFHAGRNYWGYSHPHLIKTASGDRLYYHAYHRHASGDTWMDIGSCALGAAAEPRDHRVALAPPANPDAWDSFFVADPFVVPISPASPSP